MIRLEIPGFKNVEIEHLVLDYNGTLALDGELLPAVAELISRLAEKLTIHVLTADTFGQCSQKLSGLPLTVHIISEAEEDAGKLAYVQTLNPKRCACIGNGRNDMLMLAEAALGIIVCGREGMSMQAARAADVGMMDIVSALELFETPARLVTTLRN